MMEATTEYVNLSIEDTEDLLEQIKEYDDTFIRIFLELYTLISVICVAANILIIFVILKYKRLRQEKWNIIILHWAIVNCLYMFCSPINLRLEVDLSDVVVTDKTFCFAQQVEDSLLLIDFILILILAVYWYLKLYHPEKYSKFNQQIKCVFMFVYVFFIFCLGLHLDICYNSRDVMLADLILFFAFLAFILFMVVINILHAVKKRRLTDYSNLRNIPFLLSNALFLSYLPPLLIIFIEPFLDIVTGQILIGAALLIAILSPFYFFIILYKCDKNYNVFLRHLFSCRCRKYNDELVEQPVTFSNGREQNTC